MIRFHYLKRLLITAMLLVCGANLPGIEPSDFDSLRSFTIRQWNRDEGLRASTVISLAQSREGYLWLGTDKGLARFDGSSFTLLTKSTAPALPDEIILSLTLGPDDSLWAGTMKGLARITGGEVRTFTEEHGLPDPRVLDILISNEGIIWAATPTGLARAEITDLESGFRLVPEFTGQWVTALAEGSNGTIWIGTFGSGLWQHRSGKSERLDDVPPDIRALHRHHDSGIWVGTRGEGLLHVDGDSVRRWTVSDGLTDASIYALLQSTDGSLWIGTNGGGINRLRHGRLESFDPNRKGPGIIRSLHEDREGNLWAGSYGEGLFRVTHVPFIVLTSEDGLPSNLVLPVHQARNGDLWIGTVADGAARMLEDGRWTHYDTSSGLPHNGVLTIHDDTNGDVWLGTAGGGLVRFRDGRFRRYSTTDGLSADLVTAVLPARDGSIWIGTLSGIDRLAGDTITNVAKWSSEYRVVTLMEATDGTLWVGTEGAGLFRLPPDSPADIDSTRALPGQEVIALYETSDGAVWAGTSESGLSRFREGKVATITTSEGLFENGAKQILEDDLGYLWLGGDDGLYRILRDDLEAVAEGRSARVRPITYDRSDGLIAEEIVGGVFPPGVRGENGLLFFPTVQGLAVARPQSPTERLPLVPVIEQVWVDGRPVPADESIEVPPRASRLQVHFTAPAFTDPEAVRFRYRLVGYDDQWIESDDRRIAEYTRLPPGDYTLRVAAGYDRGDWSQREATVNLTVAPAFYETLLFRLVALILLLLLGFFVHRWLTRALRRHNEELVKLVADRSRAEASLRASERRFRALIENASDLVMIVNAGGIIEYVSPSANTIIGRSPEMIEGRDIREILHPADAPAFEESFLSDLESGRTATAIVRIPSGSLPDRHLELIGRSLEFEESVERLLINCRDVTDRKTLEARLDQANRIASLGKLAATISHEFNNVLMGIRLMAETIVRTEPHGAPSQDKAGMIIDYVDRGQRVTEGILRFSQRSEPSLEPIDLESWSRKLETELRELVGPSVMVEITVSDDLQLLGDEQQLMQIFTNLALNARESMDGDGKLFIRFRRAEEASTRALGFARNFVHIEVEDTGRGIPPEILPHIFEPLYTTRKFGGTGLGLAVVHEITESHGGFVTATSNPGKGTTFHLFLPESASVSEAKPTASSPETDRTSVEALSILLIEDDPLVSGGLRYGLSDLGCSVTAVVTGREGLGALGNLVPDAVVLDVGLPDIDGLDLYEEIARLYPDLPVIFSTGHAELERLQKYLVRPNVDFLRKPYDVTVLLEKLQALVARRVAGETTDESQ